MSSNPDIILPSGTMLVPQGRAAATLAEVQALRRAVRPCWDPVRVEALAAFSEVLLRHERLRRESAAAALGFWLRPARLRELAKGFPAETGGLRVPAGMVLHITPANVDTMFVYSWALSFLAGNANIVRLTSRTSPLMGDLLELLGDIAVRHSEAMRGNWFVAYEHDDRVTAALSAACDLRIVWGGDETVRRLRAIPLNPHAGERSFASKRSLSVIDAGSYLNASAPARRQLAEKMSADILPFGQMACSSPHQVYWVGDAAPAAEAIRSFEQELEAAISARTPKHDLGAAVRRLNASFSAAAGGSASRVMLAAHSASVQAGALAQAEQADPCGAGLLFHAVCPSVGEAAALLRPDHQTITYFGLGDANRNALARQAGTAGVDRVVPVGQALDFSPNWDGYSLWADLSRMVTLG